ncbi:septum site-determining protein MinC [Selenomonas noxia]|jgi:septum site-determining protein minC|uniref:Probable septum site-determining protein MinC n=1 Tax=Selenomonas noxia F0398 TaxID=702437 RepID=A0ABN0DQC7_9FIRM|nr:septum site-determining protein MinC [Selenomonas noxia]EHG24983.1 septum site-determining protein MinC [Selenomonas noxia F0398]MBF1662246.1 septum site-determining protein MinC [Selenomonas noxia]
MSEEKIKIKGENDGLMLEFPPDLSFLEIVEELSRKLDSGSGFFLRGTLVRVPRNRFSKEELAELQELFRTHGLICRLEKPVPMRSASPVPPSPKPAAASVSPQEAMQDAPELQRMLVIDKTLRGGQAVETEGSVIVFGNVNPGAQITAGGSVDIRGTCRGLVHAGAAGDSTAFIIADHLMPTQIRIANYVARSPDEPEDFGKAERAYVKDGQIVIEPIER